MGLISRMLFSELYKILVKKVTFVGFRGAIAPHLDPPWTKAANEGRKRHLTASRQPIKIDPKNGGSFQQALWQIPTI